MGLKEFVNAHETIADILLKLNAGKLHICFNNGLVEYQFTWRQYNVAGEEEIGFCKKTFSIEQLSDDNYLVLELGTLYDQITQRQQASRSN